MRIWYSSSKGAVWATDTCFERELAPMGGVTASGGTVLRTFRRTGRVRSAQSGTFKFCPNSRVAELARKCARNAQWMRPNWRLGAARAGVAAS